MLIHTNPTWAKCNNKQETANNWHCLEEVVLEEIPHGSVVRYIPPGIEVKVHTRQPNSQHKSWQFGFVANCNTYHQSGAYQVLHNLGVDRKNQA